KRKKCARNQKSVGKNFQFWQSSFFFVKELDGGSGASVAGRKNGGGGTLFILLLYLCPSLSHPTQRRQQQGTPIWKFADFIVKWS
ncbi:MAG TPA: hypothetical protein VK255_03785, partial [Patescibacteria group bacterium]|nr:hypothetical protein [Patescibacteria group bacterium]